MSMVAKVARQGHSFGGLVNYVMGPGRAEEHTDQRVIAAADEIDVRLGTQLDTAERLSLGDQLGLYAALFPQACPAKGEVYHVVFSASKGESLTDEQWAEVARETAKVLHLDREGGGSAPWAAFRHGASTEGYDHIHFVASLVRSDGTPVKTYMRNGYADLHAIARRTEEKFGLSPLMSRGEGALPTAQRPEREACERRGRREPERETLQRTVRSAAAGAGTEAEFLDGLRAAGVLYRPRYEQGSRDKVVGYSVAMKPPDGQQPVWFGGGKLGRDLTLPALRAEWQEPTEAEAGDLARRWQGRRPGAALSTDAALQAASRQPSSRAWERAADRLEHVGTRIEEAGQLPRDQWRSLAGEAAGVTAGLARQLEPDAPGELSAAADTLARVCQRPAGTSPPPPASRAMRGVAAVTAQQRMGGSTEGWLRVVRELARLAEALSRAAQARDAANHQARMAAVAAAELRAAHDELRDHPPAHVTRPARQATIEDAPIEPGTSPAAGRTSPAPTPDFGRGPTPQQQPPSPDLGR
jgi:hypothetical protein